MPPPTARPLASARWYDRSEAGQGKTLPGESPPEESRPDGESRAADVQRLGGRGDRLTVDDRDDNLRDLDEARRDDDVAVLRRELLRRGVRRPAGTTELLAAIVADVDGGPRLVVVPSGAIS